MAGGKALAANVFVDGEFFAAGSVPPAKVAKAITNPKAWGSDDPEPAPKVEPESDESDQGDN